MSGWQSFAPATSAAPWTITVTADDAALLRTVDEFGTWAGSEYQPFTGLVRRGLLSASESDGGMSRYDLTGAGRQALEAFGPDAPA